MQKKREKKEPADQKKSDLNDTSDGMKPSIIQDTTDHNPEDPWLLNKCFFSLELN